MKLTVLLFSIISFSMCNSSKDSSQEFSSAHSLDTTQLNQAFEQYKEKELYHRRFKHQTIEALLKAHALKKVLSVTQIGNSVQGRSINEVTFGTGDKKVMLWSQMHGDEPTATMALFDLFNFLEGENDEFQAVRNLLKEKLELHFIPMLNPDGAEIYNRRNAQSIDLNRDGRKRQTIEGKLLRDRAEAVRPHYGFNLHDQNIYYNVPETKNPVSISLLAPAFNEERDVNEVRGGAMKIIVGMNNILQQYVPDAVAKYDDTFSPRGFGDNFQMLGASTVLIESGGLKGDPEKQEIRRLNFAIILNALIEIAEGSYQKYDAEDYNKIPFNASQLHDVVIRNVEIGSDSIPLRTDVGIRRSEFTVNTDYFVRGRIEDLGDMEDNYGYDEVDGTGLKLVVAKVSPQIVDSAQNLTIDQAFYLLKKGFMAVKVKEVGASKENKLHELPLIFFTQNQFYPTTEITLGGTANFFLGDETGTLKYAIVNGYVIDLSKKDKAIWKNVVF